MNQVVGTASKITHALSESNINLIMINQGASEISMMFGIHEADAEKQYYLRTNFVTTVFV